MTHRWRVKISSPTLNYYERLMGPNESMEIERDRLDSWLRREGIRSYTIDRVPAASPPAMTDDKSEKAKSMSQEEQIDAVRRWLEHCPILGDLKFVPEPAPREPVPVYGEQHEVLVEVVKGNGNPEYQWQARVEGLPFLGTGESPIMAVKSLAALYVDVILARTKRAEELEEKAKSLARSTALEEQENTRLRGIVEKTTQGDFAKAAKVVENEQMIRLISQIASYEPGVGKAPLHHHVKEILEGLVAKVGELREQVARLEGEIAAHEHQRKAIRAMVTEEPKEPNANAAPWGDESCKPLGSKNIGLIGLEIPTIPGGNDHE